MHSLVNAQLVIIYLIGISNAIRLFVISIPMAKMISKIIRICIVKEPENIQILSEYSNASAYDVLFCTYKCMLFTSGNSKPR